MCQVVINITEIQTTKHSIVDSKLELSQADISVNITMCLHWRRLSHADTLLS